jgi:hypothetical protein
MIMSSEIPGSDCARKSRQISADILTRAMVLVKFKQKEGPSKMKYSQCNRRQLSPICGWRRSGLPKDQVRTQFHPVRPLNATAFWLFR